MGGWIQINEGTCEPPADYDGLCAAVDLSNYSPSAKETFAWKCRASWACAPACKKQFDGCPEAWVDVGSGVCAAPPDYTGICSLVTDFSTFSRTKKAEWSVLC